MVDESIARTHRASTAESDSGQPSEGGTESIRRRSLGENVSGYIFLLPWFVGFFGLFLGPMLASLYLSFTEFDLLTPPEWTGLANYTKMLGDERYVNSLQVTVTYVCLSVPLKLAFSLFLAVVLQRGVRGLGLYRAVYYLPSLLAGSVAIAVLWRRVFSGNGLVNQFLDAVFGLEDLPSWVSNPSYALYTLVVLAVWEFGAPMVIFLAGLQQIPRDLYDAAAVDGAGRLGRFVRVTLPLLTPVIFFNLVMQIINSFKIFTPAYVISGGSGGPSDSTLFYTLYLYQEGFSHFRMGYASAMAWVLLLIIALFTATNFLLGRYWVHYQGREG